MPVFEKPTGKVGERTATIYFIKTLNSGYVQNLLSSLVGIPSIVTGTAKLVQSTASIKCMNKRAKCGVLIQLCGEGFAEEYFASLLCGGV